MTMNEQTFLPYGRHRVTDDDIAAVVEVLKSDWLTQGPTVPRFEDALADLTGTLETVACTNGTAALHLAMLALNIGPGDAVITSPNTFVASANCARMVGADVLFADVDSDTGLIDLQSVAYLLKQDTEHKIKAIIPVHFAGQPADLPAIHELACNHGAWVIDDACHAIGAMYENNSQIYRLGGNPHSDMTVFSFHPVKHVAMGEGGAVATDNTELAERLRLMRNHGITRSNFENTDMACNADGIPNPWYHEMSALGCNYRLTDIQAALGLSQLTRLPQSLEKRREIAQWYRETLRQIFADGEVVPLTVRPRVEHAYHLFAVRINFNRLGVSRAVAMNRMRERGIGTQVHYIPVYRQPYYRHLNDDETLVRPGMDAYYESTLSLPMYPELTRDDVERVVRELATALEISTRDHTSSGAIKQDSPVS
jgi:UDP-4-amino-4,6-dideoxy-N-acetyl-beta-L-altrosamine transaminase